MHALNKLGFFCSFCPIGFLAPSPPERFIYVYSSYFAKCQQLSSHQFFTFIFHQPPTHKTQSIKLTGVTSARKGKLQPSSQLNGRGPVNSLPSNGAWWNHHLRQSLFLKAMPALSLPTNTLTNLINLAYERRQTYEANGNFTALIGSMVIDLLQSKVPKIN